MHLVPSRASVTGALVMVSLAVGTNVNVRVMAANLNDNDQTCDDYALNIFQGLSPDVAAIQGFNYIGNTTAGFRAMLDAKFSYFGESAA